MSTRKKTLEETYTKYEGHEHVLARPGMYIGDISKVIDEKWTFSGDNTIIKKMIKYSAGFLKIFDEVLTNATDHATRNDTVTMIKINIDIENNEISVYNNGPGIPVQIHKKHQIYIPELIFSNLLAGSNFDDSDHRKTAGTNGLGIKCISEDTLVPLFNGPVVLAKDIVVGDCLIGDDGTARRVESTMQRHGIMYSVSQERGKLYKVNDNHMLTLHVPHYKDIYWNKSGWEMIYCDFYGVIKAKFMTAYTICHICQTELNDGYKEHYKEFHPNDKPRIQYTTNPNMANICTIRTRSRMQEFADTLPGIAGEPLVFDIHIQDYLDLSKSIQDNIKGLRGECVDWDSKSTLELPYTAGYKFNENECKYGYGHTDYLPYIRENYIINSRENRLEFLAGFIDASNGYSSKSKDAIVIKGESLLINQIEYLCHTLGFYCIKINRFLSKCKLYIHGNLSLIPCRNKIIVQDTCMKSTGRITVSKLNNGIYIGLSIDGNKRFLINDFTVTHNCCNIFSKKFTVETIDSDEKKKYIQEFSENMNKKSKPKITTNSGKSFTKITFQADFPRFGMKDLASEKDTIALLKKRVIDCIAITNPNVAIYLNGEKLKGKGLVDYGKYFTNGASAIYESNGNAKYLWEYSVLPNPSAHFDQVSFVNGVDTTLGGGTHVNYIINQITSKLIKLIETRKKITDVKPMSIKDRIFLLLSATVINPTFNSQLKITLTTSSRDFGCNPQVSDKFIEKLYKSSITDEIVELYKLKEISKLSKEGGKKVTKLYGIPNLDDALLAGTNKSRECTLMLCEGKSASSFGMWGKSIIEFEKYGNYSLKGKVLNTRGATVSQLVNNVEINNLNKIIGLKPGVEYTEKNIHTLRYGKIMLLTDADEDGCHILSLVVNLFHDKYPSLLKMNFLSTLKTPIVKAIKGKETIEFFNEQDYTKWKASVNESRYTIKYFKGLGTSDKLDAQSIFKRLNKLVVELYHKNSECDRAVILAFEKDKGKKIKEESQDDANEGTLVKFTDKRKEWLRNYDKNSYIDMNQSKVSLQELINKQLIHFSVGDNARSIPSICDGLKPSQRKILYYMIKNTISKDKGIKVAQLSGYISASMSYHHGEDSLNKAIVNMAQNHIGTNNLNLLEPMGNFGSRNNTDDAASPRYIFTNLSKYTPLIFNTDDLNILNYLSDDGVVIEPEWFVPIIPMILVNGAIGIGTGFSTSIPKYNPQDIIEYLMKLIDGSEGMSPTPWFKDFGGSVTNVGNGKFTTNGRWKRVDDTSIQVNELPIGMTVMGYKEFLEGLIEKKEKDKEAKIKSKLVIKDFDNLTRDESTGINFIIKLSKNVLDELIKTDSIEKEFKLTKSFSTNNMYLFNKDLILTKYDTVDDIIKEFYNIRLEYYSKRREYLLIKLKRDLDILENKMRFITDYMDGTLIINKKSKESIIGILNEKGYFCNDGFDYLLNLPVYSFTLEKIKSLEKQLSDKQHQYTELQNHTPNSIWKSELEKLKQTF